MILINSSPKNALKIFQPFLPIYVPVGIGCLLAAAEGQGIEVQVIDEQVESNILKSIKGYVQKMHTPYIFGFSVLTVALKNAINLAEELKRLYPDSVIVFGGIHPTAMPEEILSYGCVDIVLRGEGERVLFELYKCLKAKKDFTYLDSISYRKGNTIIHNKMSLTLDYGDNSTYFPYHRFNAKRYDLGFILSSRGCPYECIFCSNRVTTGRGYRFKSTQVIIEELNLLYNKYKRKYITFVDDNLLVDKERIYLIIDNIKKKKFDEKITFNCQARADNVSFALLKDLYSAGFRSIFFGMETSSERIMKIIKKNETVAECIQAVKMAKDAGFHVSATFIYGFPTETYADRMNCARLSKELNLDMVRFNNATPYPGTELYAMAKSQNRINIQGLYDNFVSVSTFIENPFKKIPFSYVPEGNTEDEIRRDILFSYFAFYLDFNKLKKIFTRPEQGVGWFNAGEKAIKFLGKIPAIIFLGSMLLFKFCQFFYYMVIKKETAISFKESLKVFNRK